MAQTVQMFRDDAGEMHDNKLSAAVGDAKFALYSHFMSHDFNDRHAREIVGIIQHSGSRDLIQKLYKAIDQKIKVEIS